MEHFQSRKFEAKEMRIGDLFYLDYLSKRGLVLKTDSYRNECAIVLEDGRVYEEWNDEIFNFGHNTGLSYIYTSKFAAQQDFRNGVFTPHFEIL